MDAPRVPRSKTQAKDGRFNPAFFLETVAKGGSFPRIAKVKFSLRKAKTRTRSSIFERARSKLPSSRRRVRKPSSRLWRRRIRGRGMLDWAAEALGDRERNVGLRNRCV